MHDLPGVTRDRREGDAQVGDLHFRLIDTAGLEDESDLSTTEGRMRAQTDVAMRSADVILMMVDARAGVTPLDAHFADLLRRQDKPVILVANKCEGRISQPGLFEAFGLGLGEPVPVSSEHGEGMGGLYEALRPYADAADPPADPEAEDPAAASDDDEAALAARPLSLAIVGRPNVGKSTLVNRLLGEERMLTGPEAGLTRDAIASAFEWRGRPLTLVDTAGLRRKARIEESLEKLSAQDTLNAVRMAAVVALVLDANAVLEKQDLTIARHVIDEGRALVVIVNKWDIADDKGEILERLKDRLANALPQVRGIPFVTVSALKGHGMDRMMETVFGIYEYLEPPRFHPAAQRVAEGDDRTPPAAARRPRPPPARALYHPGENPSADLRRLRLPRRRHAGLLRPLSGQRPCATPSASTASPSASSSARARTPTPGRSRGRENFAEGRGPSAPPLTFGFCAQRYRAIAQRDGCLPLRGEKS